jgi:hypothetical protein
VPVKFGEAGADADVALILRLGGGGGENGARGREAGLDPKAVVVVVSGGLVGDGGRPDDGEGGG